MKIKVYSSPSCTFCESLKKYLEDKKVKFEEIDVTSSVEALDELKEKTGMLSVPVTVVYEEDEKKIKEVISGFDKDKLDNYIEV